MAPIKSIASVVPDPVHVGVAPGQWFPANHQALCSWLTRLKPGAAGAAPPSAVFDWDNTCAFNDIGEATFRYMLDTLSLRLTPQALDTLLPRRVTGTTTFDTGVVMAALAEDIIGAYRSLWPKIAAGEAQEVRHNAAHRDFKAKLAYLYFALETAAAAGPRYAYPWLPCLFGGHTPAAVMEMAQSAWRLGQTERPGTLTWRSGSAGRAGMVAAKFATGLRLHDEMADLIGVLQAHGITTTLITASTEHLVRGLVAELGLPVAPNNIFGMRLAEADGLLQAQLLHRGSYPHTYREGKLQIVRDHMRATPLLVAGDADTDLDMLGAGLPNTQVRLVINRNLTGEIRSLYRVALQPGQRSQLTLLQGRDENLGSFRPSQETIPLGETRPQTLIV